MRKWYVWKYFELELFPEIHSYLEKVNNRENQNKITSNINYHPVFRDARKILEELHVILASGDGQKKVLPDVPMIGFKINKNLKAHLVRSELQDFDEVGTSKPCGTSKPYLLVIY